MVSRVTTVAFQGIEAKKVDVQVKISPGTVSFTIVGLGDKAVAESKERVRAALNSLGLSMPTKRIVVNLAPADLPKVGSHYDLPIALGIMAAIGAIPADSLNDYIALGELALDGLLRRVNGSLPAAMAASEAGLGLICPHDSGAEAAWASSELEILAPSSLVELLNHFKGIQSLKRPEPTIVAPPAETFDLIDIRGQEMAKRAIEVAAAGGHDFLISGQPGAAKSMLASRLASLLPPLNPKELLEVSIIHSIAGVLQGGALSDRRPCRSPHHSASMPALVGGGYYALPGEISLAHNGVLFLDEIAEFQPQVLDSLRQPMETGQIHLSRANNRVIYPAKFQLIATMNPCRCGKATVGGFACKRQPNERCMAQYQSRISGPLLDRIDMHLTMAPVKPEDLFMAPIAKENSATVAKRVALARDIQEKRYTAIGLPAGTTNAVINNQQLEKTLRIQPDAQKLLTKAAEKFSLSSRGLHQALKVARTAADLSGEEIITKDHIAEALFYRLRDIESDSEIPSRN